MFTIQDSLSSLNENQNEAVRLSGSSGLILAGAGSGKTKVLTTRIAYLVDGGMPVDKILAVTFTNKASKEMKERIGKFGIDVKDLWIGTFHSLANKLLRIHHVKAGLSKSFYILDNQEQQSLIKKVIKNNGYSIDSLDPGHIQNFINSNKENGLRSHQLDLATAEKNIYELYEKECKKENCVDFAELLLSSYELLAKNDDIREYYANKFSHILIDEFQDTNILQYKWLKLLKTDDNYFFAVGDDDQSIYSFRGANPENIQKYCKEFAPVKIIKLEQNYRSLKHILDAANHLIGFNKNRQGKNLWTDKEQSDKIMVYRGENDKFEANFIANEIKNLRREKISYRDMAILYRTNSQSRTLEKILQSANIPFIIYGGFRFFDRQEVKNTMAYLRLANNNHDNLAFSRVVNFPMRGIGETTVKKIAELAKENHLSYYDASKLLTGKAKEKVDVFIQIINDISIVCSNQALTEQVKSVIEYSGLEDFYKRNIKEDPERLDNIYELVSAAEVFLEENPTSKIDDFLAFSSLESDIKSKKRDENLDAVKLMTVHAAKGLEFNTVFVTGLEENLFPHANSKGENDSLEEERRLMYVAITRAKKRLYLTFAGSRMFLGKFQEYEYSRFFKEIPKELMKRIY